jgi:transglutaminase-like putative cysteine protease
MFCVSAPPWLTEDEEIRRTALGLVDNETNVLRIVKKFVAWIWENIKYPSQGHEVPFYPNETLKNREGDCDDQAILFATFCRILGIPSYVQTGCVYLSTFQSNATAWDGHIISELSRIGWHGWAAVYIPPWGWLPVDLTFVIGSLDDPVNAIECSAATLQQVIQYMNISESDYVASTRSYRDFLQKNGFYLYSRDEMDVTFLGDLNCDFVVNILDVAVVAKAYGSTFESPYWNGMADVAEPYGVVNILDVAEVAKEFGLTG